MDVKAVGFFGHPAWAGVSAIASIIALFLAGLGQQTIDRVFHAFPALTWHGSSMSTQPPKPASNQQRIALLIGNQDYLSAPKLSSPVNDVDLIAEKLQRQHFKVIIKKDLNFAQMKDTIQNFQTILTSGGVGVMYYAAYINGEDIIFPIDVNVETFFGIVNAANARGITSVLTDKKSENVIYLNDLLKPVDQIFIDQPASNGAITIYSTSKYKIAFDVDERNPNIKHSPFARALADAMFADDEIFSMFRTLTKSVADATSGRQVPSIEAAVNIEFFFARPWRDRDIGILKLLIIDGCRDNPLTATSH